MERGYNHGFVAPMASNRFHIRIQLGQIHQTNVPQINLMKSPQPNCIDALT